MAYHHHYISLFLAIVVTSSLLSTGKAFTPLLPCSTFLGPSGEDASQHNSKSSSALRSFDLKSTLNEDGDFCIEGINDDKTAATSGDGNGGQFTSILDMEYNQVKNSKLSDILLTPSTTPSNDDDDVRFETIDNDDDSNWSSTTRNEGSAILDHPFPFLQGAAQAVAPSIANVEQPMATTASPVASPIQPVAPPSPVATLNNSNFDPTALEALEGFLHSVFGSGGSVSSQDIDNYALQLLEIGFDPDCEWSQELEYEDLHFMKTLHQRFFWKEWEKLLL